MSLLPFLRVRKLGAWAGNDTHIELAFSRYRGFHLLGLAVIGGAVLWLTCVSWVLDCGANLLRNLRRMPSAGSSSVLW